MKKEDILEDYGIAVLSRECSLMGRKEVLTGSVWRLSEWLLSRPNPYDGSWGTYS